MARSKPLIFISHVHEDAGLAACLKSFLDDAFLGFFEIFLSSDGASIRAGDNWAASIETALKRADLVLVILTATAVERRWIYFEAGGAYFAGTRVIPICCRQMKVSEVLVPLSWLQVIEGWDSSQATQLIGDIAAFFELRVPRVRSPELAAYLRGEPCDGSETAVTATEAQQALPVFALVDTSGSMSGAPIVQMTDALTQFVDFLRVLSLTGRSVLFSLITFGSEARLVLPLQPVFNIVRIPDLVAGGASNLGAALRLLNTALSNSSVLPRHSAPPLITLITDGLPTDDWQAALESLESNPRARGAVRYFIGIGDLDSTFATRFASENIALVESPATSADLEALFRWLAVSAAPQDDSPMSVWRPPGTWLRTPT